MSATQTTAEASVYSLPAVPDGLTIASADNRFFAFRMTCQAHDRCRERGMVFTAADWSEVADRVVPAFERHCRDMATANA